MQVQRIQMIGLCKFHFRPTPLLIYDRTWLSGRSIYATRNRTQQVTAPVAQLFPPVPDRLSDFDRLGINRRPTFFGCDPKQNPAEFPLLIWLPNAPPADGSDPVTK